MVFSVSLESLQTVLTTTVGVQNLNKDFPSTVSLQTAHWKLILATTTPKVCSIFIKLTKVKSFLCLPKWISEQFSGSFMTVTSLLSIVIQAFS